MNLNVIVKIVLALTMLLGLSACQDQDVSKDIAHAEFRVQEPVKAAQPVTDQTPVNQSNEEKPAVDTVTTENIEETHATAVIKEQEEEAEQEIKQTTSVKTEQQVNQVMTEQTAVTATVEPKEEKVIAVGDDIKGKKVAKKCAGCHTFDIGGKNKVGPNLFAIVGKKKGASAGFKYGSYLKNSNASWNEDDLRAWLADSKGVAKAAGAKSKMASQKITGTKADDLIAYLKTLK